MLMLTEERQRRGWSRAELARRADMSQREAEHIIDEVRSAVCCWPNHAAEAGVSTAGIEQIAKSLSEIDRACR